MSDRIEKAIELDAPVSRVWRALTDYREFGSWFRVRLDGPFVPGQVTRGQITYPGYEHIRFAAVVQKIESKRLFLSPGILMRSIRMRIIRRRRRRSLSLHWRRAREAHCFASSSPVSTSFRVNAASRPFA